jgi:hypothetical protein
MPINFNRLKIKKIDGTLFALPLLNEGGQNMKRISFPLLVGGLMTTIFIITGCTTAGDGALTSQRITTGQGAGQTLSRDLGSSEPQLESFDRAFEDSKKQFDLKLAQEKERMEGTFTVAKEKVKK